MHVGGADRFRRGGSAHIVDVGHDDGGALGGETLGDGKADAAGGAGDDGNPVFQAHEGFSVMQSQNPHAEGARFSAQTAVVGIDDD